MRTDKLFTGQQREDQAPSSLLLYNYGARFYSTLTGRFVSPDPLIATPGDPQVLNAYSYVHNNPLKYVDPMGLCFTMPDGTQLECTPKLWQQWLDCALNGACGPDVQVLARAGIQQERYWDYAWEYVYWQSEWVFVETILKGEVTGKQLRQRLDVIPPYGWDVMGRIFDVSGPFLKASLYDMISGTRTIAELPWQYIVGAYPWWRDEIKGWVIERQYHIPWNERASNLEDVLIELTRNWADVMLQAGTDINVELRWSHWQRELLHALDYPVQLEQPDRSLYSVIEALYCLMHGCVPISPGVR